MKRGVIVGCDQRLEWALPWWWEHYSAHNDYPVVFFDFGMSAKARAWCAKRGQLKALDSSHVVSPSEGPLPLEKRIPWEWKYGEVVWEVRRAWLQKPMAMLHSPFSLGLWLDLDCRVDGNLQPLFDILQRKDTFAVLKQDRKIGWRGCNSGVVIFRKGSKILKMWAQSVLESPDALPGDDDYLGPIAKLHNSEIVHLPSIYNWSWQKEKNGRALVVHFHGSDGKLTLLKSIGPEKFARLMD